MFISEPSSSWSLVFLYGKDTQSFLHRLSTVDTLKLPCQNGTLGFFLNQTGKIQLTFFLWKQSPSLFILTFESGKNNFWKKKLKTFLSLYHFREDLHYCFLPVPPSVHGPFSNPTLISHGFSKWIFSSPSFLKSNSFKIWKEKKHIYFLSRFEKKIFFLNTYDFWKIPFHQIPSHITDQIPSSSFTQVSKAFLPFFPSTSATLPSVFFSELQAARIWNGFAWPEFEITTEQNPLEIGLGTFLSKNKGCYPGQEVMERILSRNRIPPWNLRKCFCLNLTHTFNSKSFFSKLPIPLFESTTENTPCGFLTSFYTQKNKIWALGRIRKTHLKHTQLWSSCQKPFQILSLKKPFPFAPICLQKLS